MFVLKLTFHLYSIKYKVTDSNGIGELWREHTQFVNVHKEKEWVTLKKDSSPQNSENI